MNSLSRVFRKSFPLLLCAVAGLAQAGAIQFDFLNPGYTQDIFAGPVLPGPGVSGAGMVWLPNGNMVIKKGNQLVEYGTATTVYQGTTVRQVAITHVVSGLDSSVSSVGITAGFGGVIYANTPSGLQSINPGLLTATTITGTLGLGTGYGITTLIDGRIAYVGGTGNSIYLYDPILHTNSLLFNSPSSTFFDDIEANATGQIGLAGLYEKQLLIIDALTGSLINTVGTGNHNPDGLAFISGIATQALLVNNNDGSISRFDFSAGYTSLTGATDIATSVAGHRAYGDLAACGPDGGFYVSQFNLGQRGSDPGHGTHWDNGVSTGEASIVRIGSSTPGGSLCAAGFNQTPEPGGLSLVLLALGVTLAAGRLARRGPRPA